VRREVREELEKLRSETKMNDLSDLLILLVKTYREYTNTISKLEEVLTNIVSKAVKEALSSFTNAVSKETISHTNVISTSASSHATKGGKMTAFERFIRDGYVFFSDLARSRSVRFPERLYEAIKRNALGNKVKLVEVKTDEDRVLLKAEKWKEFRDKLAEVKSPDEREVFSVLKDEWHRKLFTILSKAGAIYFHAKSKNWELDYGFIEELEESPSSPTAVGDEEL
jgi:hypothetical protein